jgi:hypothetical protein
MAITTGSDRLFVESLGTLTVGLGEGDDLYVIDGSGTGANSRITINDTGVNRVQLTGGLTIKSSLVASNTTVLTLSNDAEITISNAAGFSYIIGGTPGTGTGGTTQDYTQFVTTTLGAASVPTTGSVSGTANKTIANTTTPSTLPTLSIASATVAEGNTGTANLVFNVTLSAASTTPVTVAYATTGVTAVSGADFTATSGTLTINAGLTTGTITVPVTGDTIFEANETLTVTLSNSSANATVLASASSATGTITNDDTNALPVITIPTTTPSAFIGQSTSVTGISFTDADDNAGFTVTVQASGASQVSFSNLDNVTAKNAAATTIAAGESSNLITLSGTKANVNTALTKLQYSTNSTIPTTEAVTVTVTDPNAGAASRIMNVNIGSALTLTSVSDSLVGSAGDDLFSGTLANFGTGDTLVGSTGVDKLTLTAVGTTDGITSAGAGTYALPTLTTASTGIDVLDLTTFAHNDDQIASFNAVQYGSTLTTVNFTTNSTTAGTADDGDGLTATTANAGTTFNIQKTMGTLTLTALNGTEGTTDAFTVNLAGGTTLTSFVGAGTSTTLTDILNVNSNGTSANAITLTSLGTSATVNAGGSQEINFNTLPSLGTGSFNGANATGKITVTAFNAATTIIGGSAGDVITGGTLADSLSGGLGNDTIVSGASTDTTGNTIVGGAGADSLTGNGTGVNTFVFTTGDSLATARDTIVGAKENDIIKIGGYGITALTNDTVLTSTGTIKIDATNARLVVGTDEINLPTALANAAFTYKTNGTADVSDDYILIGAAPLVATNDALGTLTLTGKAISTANVVMSALNAPTVNTSTIGSNQVNKFVATNVTNSGVSVTGSTAADSITGSPQADTIFGGSNGTKEVQTIALTWSTATENNVVTINGVPITFASGTSTTTAAANLLTAINASTSLTNVVSATNTSDVITVTWLVDGDASLSALTTTTNTTAVFNTTTAGTVSTDGADTLIGGLGADTIKGNGGQDVITLTEATAAIDSIVFDTPFVAGNASADTITGFTLGTAGAGVDTYNVQFNVLNGTTTATNQLVALTPVAVASNGTATTNDVIFTFAGAGDLLAAGTTISTAVANAVTALTSGTDFSSANIATGDSLILQMNDGTNTFIFHYVADGTPATTAAADLELIGILNATTTAAVVGNFI